MIARSLWAIIRKHIFLTFDLTLTLHVTSERKFLMRIGIFSFRAFDRRLARLAAPISSGVRQGGRICPPAGRVRLNTPAGRGLRADFSVVYRVMGESFVRGDTRRGPVQQSLPVQEMCVCVCPSNSVKYVLFLFCDYTVTTCAPIHILFYFLGSDFFWATTLVDG